MKKRQRKPVTEVLREGQPFVDVPVYRSFEPTRLARVVGSAPLMTQEIERYDRIELRWMKPDGNGGLIPR